MASPQDETFWRRWADAPDFEVSRDSIDVTTAGPAGSEHTRRHRVTVAQQKNAIVLSALVARESQLHDPESAATDLWIANRAHRLASFRINRDGAVIATCTLPTAGLDAEEFRFAVRHLAREADRVEFQLTGRDSH
jgi:hypothetical protein